jgi:hypothetical protein
MSDLSGPSFRSGFDSYITGYALAGGEYFCLARTWFAPEMPRPGCVWTHTIYMSDAELGKVLDLTSILPKFRRPSSPSDIRGYDLELLDQTSLTTGQTRTNAIRRRIALEDAELPDGKSPLGGPPDQAFLRRIIQAVYGSDLSVAIPSETSMGFDVLLLSVVTQQWARLRRTFRFCTGSLSLRPTEFDVAIVPPEVLRAVDEEAVVLVPPSTGAPNVRVDKTYDAWAIAAAEDLRQGSRGTALREFLWAYGPELKDGRPAFKALCDVYLARESIDRPLDRTLGMVAHYYAEPNEAARLKHDLFSKAGHFSKSLEGESAVLAALIKYPAADSISTTTAEIARRATQLTSDNPGAAIDIAQTAIRIRGDRGSRYLDGFCTALFRQQNHLPKLPFGLVVELLKRNPAVATAPEIWKRPTQEQIALATQTIQMDITGNVPKGITSAALSARAWSALPVLFSALGELSIAEALTWLDDNSEEQDDAPRAVIQALDDYRSLILPMLNKGVIKDRALFYLTTILDPRAPDVRRLGTTPWLGVTSSSRDHLLILRSQIFLLSIALSSREDGGIILLQKTFGPVYEAAKQGGLDDALWQFLDPYLPWIYSAWDRCARLSKGVVRAFVDHEWNAADFISIFRTEEQFARGLTDLDATFAGARYLKKMCRLYLDGGLKLSAARSSMLQESCGRALPKH